MYACDNTDLLNVCTDKPPWKQTRPCPRAGFSLPHTVADNLSLSLSALVYTVADNLSLSLSLSTLKTRCNVAISDNLSLSVRVDKKSLSQAMDKV